MLDFTNDRAVLARFLKKIQVDDYGCWIWAGSKTGSGYAGVRIFKKAYRAHRVSYTMFIGPIPDGYHIDHLCCNRLCVNPDHLEAVTQTENNRRTIDRGRFVSGHSKKTHCPRNHPYFGDNLYIDSRGRRVCKTCKRLSPNY